MDMQGTPIGGNAGATKNTSDPRASDPIHEKPGAVASDSLAAESYNAGGGFSENRDSAPYKQSGSSSTFNNTDTSGATVLDAARNAHDRETEETYGQTSDSNKGRSGLNYAEGAGGQGEGSSGKLGEYGNTGSGGSGSSGGDGYSGGSYSEGQTSATGFGGSGSDAVGSTGESGNYGTGGGRSGGGSGQAGEAPTYVHNQYVSDPSGPHGKNLQEGGFEGEARGGFAEPGSEDDPGRAALGKFQNASAAAPGETGPRHGRDTENTYENLDRS